MYTYIYIRYIYIYISYVYIYIYIYICIDKADSLDPTRREEYWKKVLKTAAPNGLNTLN